MRHFSLSRFGLSPRNPGHTYRHVTPRGACLVHRPAACVVPRASAPPARPHSFLPLRADARRRGGGEHFGPKIAAKSDALLEGFAWGRRLHFEPRGEPARARSVSPPPPSGSEAKHDSAALAELPGEGGAGGARSWPLASGARRPWQRRVSDAHEPRRKRAAAMTRARRSGARMRGGPGRAGCERGRCARRHTRTGQHH